MIDDAQFEVFREQHAAPAFHVAAMMQAALRLREAERYEMLAQGKPGTLGGLRTELNHHKAKVKALVASM